LSGDQTSGGGDLNREYYFPTPIYYRDVPGAAELNARIRPLIYAWRERDPEGIVRSNVHRAGAWHSPVDMNRREEFGELTERVTATAAEVFRDQGYDPGSPPVCDNMWANISPRHGFNRHHVHPNVLWSGVYYVQTPPGCGRIFFTDPRPQSMMLTARHHPDRPRGVEAWSEVYFEPIEGRILLFPSWLVHEVEPNLSTEPGPAADRISVSFNFFQGRPAD
jgi:uncharacterized protein (TIGR02466 family)